MLERSQKTKETLQKYTQQTAETVHFIYEFPRTYKFIIETYTFTRWLYVHGILHHNRKSSGVLVRQAAVSVLLLSPFYRTSSSIVIASAPLEQNGKKNDFALIINASMDNSRAACREEREKDTAFAIVITPSKHLHTLAHTQAHKVVTARRKILYIYYGMHRFHSYATAAAVQWYIFVFEPRVLLLTIFLRERVRSHYRIDKPQLTLLISCVLRKDAASTHQCGTFIAPKKRVHKQQYTIYIYIVYRYISIYIIHTICL